MWSRSAGARSMGISRRGLRMRALMTWRAERLWGGAAAVAELGSFGNRGPRLIWALRDAGRNECCGDRRWTSETDRRSGECSCRRDLRGWVAEGGAAGVRRAILRPIT
jgi:hypothetical protein